MAYQALYRQWRPATFSDMVGQELVVTALRNQVQQGRIAHAYLFTGSRGTGKTSAAKILARAVNCQHPVNGDPCGECESCRRMQGDASFDVLEYDAASNSRVEDMRQILETTQYPPQYGKYKVYIIDEVHMLSDNAFNALLKTLEEPPEHMIFVLATTEPQKVLATILSRCQRYDFGRIPAQKIAGRLRQAVEMEHREATDGALMNIAVAAEGGMRDALSILDMCLGYGEKVDEALVRRVLGTSGREFLFRFSEALIEEDAAAVFSLIDQLMREGREPAVFAREMARHLRAMLMAHYCPGELAELLELTAEDAQSYIGQASGVSDTRLMSMIDLMMSVEPKLRLSSSPRVALETAALHACLRTGEEDTTALRERIETLEKQLAGLREELHSGALTVSPGAARPEKKERAPEVQAPKAAPAPMPKDLQQVWKGAMEIVKRKNPGLFGMLSSGSLMEAADDCFVWGVKDESFLFSLDHVNRPEHREQIEEALSETAGRPCHFTVQLPETQKKATATEADTLRGLRETFGADRVMVQEE